MGIPRTGEIIPTCPGLRFSNYPINYCTYIHKTCFNRVGLYIFFKKLRRTHLDVYSHVHERLRLVGQVELGVVPGDADGVALGADPLPAELRRALGNDVFNLKKGKGGIFLKCT